MWNRNRGPKPEPPVKETKEKDSTTMARGKYKYIVRDSALKEVSTVYADRATHGNGSYFWVGENSNLAAHFPEGYSFTRVEEDTRAYAEPVAGVEYYTLEDLRRALKDLGYVSTESIVTKVSQRVSVRDDGRYSLNELKNAARQIDNISGEYYAKKLEEAGLQARKNRVWDAHTR